MGSDLGQVDFESDVVFPWNGTTSGVRIPNGDWIADDRTGKGRFYIGLALREPTKPDVMGEIVRGAFGTS